jgi:DNA helicase-2/ATP-dependent DNA helicase PcrA
VTLEQNYRSVPAILETTNRLIAHAKERYTKDLWSVRPPGRRPWLVTCRDEAEQDAYVVSRILQHYEEGIPLHKQAVLFRAGHLSDSLEIELTRRKIPYHKYGGLRFLEAAHVKDLVSFLRVAENPRDEMAWFRVLQLIEGVGPATASKAVGHIVTATSKVEALRAFEPPAAAREGFAGLADLLADLDNLGARHPAAQVERIRKYYDPILERHYENAAMRQRDLEHIEQIAANYTSRRQFLTDLTLDPPTSTSDLAGPPSRDEDWLVLSTIHSAKGCEWDAVYVIHAADGFLPSDLATGREEEIDEERRLTYVAMTRAKDFLYITWPLRYYHRWSSFTDRHTYAQLCRFLTEDVRATCELQNAGVSYGEGYETVAPPRPGPSRTRIRDMWD